MTASTEEIGRFITGELDPVNFFIRDVNLLDIIEVYYDDLRVKKIVEKCGHWTQQEKPEEVNKILLWSLISDKLDFDCSTWSFLFNTLFIETKICICGKELTKTIFDNVQTFTF